MQEKHNAIANALVLRLSCTYPLIYRYQAMARGVNIRFYDDSRDST